MSAAMKFRMTDEPTAVTADRFKKLLAALDLDYGITYRWDNSTGRGYRHGIIEVYDLEVGPVDGVVESQEFARATHLWTDADAHIGMMRHGSPKHRAVQALLARIAARTDLTA